MDQLLLGSRLRAARQAQSVSLRSVATAIGVSPSLLSQIENGKTNPSVDTLYALVQQLGISVDVMLGIEATGRSKTRTASPVPSGGTLVQTLEETPVIEMQNGVRWERLAVLPGQDVEALRVTYQPGASSSLQGHLMHHFGCEHLVLVSGELQVRFSDEEITLRTGDSMAFDSRRPHLFVNESGHPALGIWHVLGRQAQLSQLGSHGFDQANPDEPEYPDGPNRSEPNSAVEVLRSFRQG